MTECIGTSAAQRMIAKNIKAGKWSVVGVASEVAAPFAYTVGLHSLGLPEIILIGINPKIGQSILNQCAAAMLSQCHSFASAAILDTLANLPLCILDAGDEGKKEYALQAFNFYKHWDFRLQQLVMPDAKGILPWQTGFDTSMNGIQPLLGRVT